MISLSISRGECSGFFDFSCHIQYICMSWVLLFGLLLAAFPTGNLTLPLMKLPQNSLSNESSTQLGYDSDTVNLQFWCCCGFYIKRDSSTLFMTGGKTIFKTAVGQLESLTLTDTGTFLTDITLTMVSIITRKGGTTSMREEDMVTENWGVWIGTPITITTFTTSIKINSSTSTGRVQVLWPWTDWTMRLLNTTGGEDREGLQKDPPSLPDRTERSIEFKALYMELEQSVLLSL